MLNADYFAYRQYRDYVIYKVLAEKEKNRAFRATLEMLIGHEWEDYEFWRRLSAKKEFRIGALRIFAFRFARVVLGLTFVAKLLEGRERQMIREYREYMASVQDEGVKEGIARIIEHEQYHERQLIGQIEEKRVKFLSNIILGLNDGLVELTGALVGFSFAVGGNALVGMLGLVTGTAAALSMASSAYVQALYDERAKDAKRAALFTGIAYFLVAIILVTPFLFVAERAAAILFMLFFAIVIIGIASFYGAVLFEREFKKEFPRMVGMSLGVAAVTFAVGSILRIVFGIEGV